MNSTPLDMLTLATFAPLVHSSFQVRASDQAGIELELVEAAAGRTVEGKDAARYESFSLVFHGPEASPLTQRIHRLEHPQLGGFELFLVPIGRAPGILKYQAVFNRMVSAG